MPGGSFPTPTLLSLVFETVRARERERKYERDSSHVMSSARDQLRTAALAPPLVASRTDSSPARRCTARARCTSPPALALLLLLDRALPPAHVRRPERVELRVLVVVERAVDDVARLELELGAAVEPRWELVVVVVVVAGAEERGAGGRREPRGRRRVRARRRRSSSSSSSCSRFVARQRPSRRRALAASSCSRSAARVRGHAALGGRERGEPVVGLGLGERVVRVVASREAVCESSRVGEEEGMEGGEGGERRAGSVRAREEGAREEVGEARGGMRGRERERGDSRGGGGGEREERGAEGEPDGESETNRMPPNMPPSSSGSSSSPLATPLPLPAAGTPIAAARSARRSARARSSAAARRCRASESCSERAVVPEAVEDEPGVGPEFFCEHEGASALFESVRS